MHGRVDGPQPAWQDHLGLEQRGLQHHTLQAAGSRRAGAEVPGGRQGRVSTLWSARQPARLLPQVGHAAGDGACGGVGKGGCVVVAVDQQLGLHNGHHAAGLTNKPKRKQASNTTSI